MTVTPSRADMILVSCVKQKQNHPAAAKDLYVSSLFRKECAYAEGSVALWFILSAKHGLVGPDEVLDPYELRLSEMPIDYRSA